MCRHFNVYVQLHVWSIHLTSLKCDHLAFPCTKHMNINKFIVSTQKKDHWKDL